MSANEVTWETSHGDTVTVYPSSIGDGSLSRPLSSAWRYRVTARNNRVVEQGTEGYRRHAAAVKAALRHHPRIES